MYQTQSIYGVQCSAFGFAKVFFANVSKTTFHQSFLPPKFLTIQYMVTITVAELKTRYICIIPSRRQRRAAISCIPLLLSLPFAAINNWFCRNFCVSRLFFSWLHETIANYTTIHSGSPITIALHRCAFIINYTYTYIYTSTINQLKHRFASGNMEKITLGHGLKPNIALGYASCYISLLTAASCYSFRIALTAVL